MSIVLLMLIIISGVSWIECPNTVTIENVQYSIYNTYNFSTTAYIHRAGIQGSSGAVYFGSLAGASSNYGSPTTALVSKQAPNSENIEWVKLFYLFPFWEDGFYLTQDENNIFIIRDLSLISVGIIQVSTNDGELINFYEK